MANFHIIAWMTGWNVTKYFSQQISMCPIQPRQPLRNLLPICACWSAWPSFVTFHSGLGDDTTTPSCWLWIITNLPSHQLPFPRSVLKPTNCINYRSPSLHGTFSPDDLPSFFNNVCFSPISYLSPSVSMSFTTPQLPSCFGCTFSLLLCDLLWIFYNYIRFIESMKVDHLVLGMTYILRTYRLFNKYSTSPYPPCPPT